MLVCSLRDDNIIGENFKHFLLYYLQSSTYFSVTVVEENRILPELNDYLQQSFETTLWYRYKIYGAPLAIMLYRSSPALLEELMKYFDCLFPAHTKGIEDICFFKDTKLMFGSVTHERIAEAVLLSETTNIKAIEKLAVWEKRIIQTREYAFYPDLEKYL